MLRVSPASRGLLGATPILLLLTHAGEAGAQTNASFQARATIVQGCQVSGGGEGQWGNLNFGSHPALLAGEAEAEVSLADAFELRCTPGVTLAMAVDAGRHSAATRQLQEAQTGTHLPYRLYRDAAMSQELSPGQSVTLSYTDPAQIEVPIFGRVTLPGDSPVGMYTDTVTVTLSW